MVEIIKDLKDQLLEQMDNEVNERGAERLDPDMVDMVITVLLRKPWRAAAAILAALVAILAALAVMDTAGAMRAALRAMETAADGLTSMDVVIRAEIRWVTLIPSRVSAIS